MVVRELASAGHRGRVTPLGARARGMIVHWRRVKDSRDQRVLYRERQGRKARRRVAASIVDPLRAVHVETGQRQLEKAERRDSQQPDVDKDEVRGEVGLKRQLVREHAPEQVGRVAGKPRDEERQAEARDRLVAVVLDELRHLSAEPREDGRRSKHVRERRPVEQHEHGLGAGTRGVGALL